MKPSEPIPTLMTLSAVNFSAGSGAPGRVPTEAVDSTAC